MSESKGTTKALQPIGFNAPAITESANFQRVMELNFSGRQLSPTDLSRVKFPTGGGTKWTTEDNEGEDSQSASFTGVVIVQHSVNAYWPGEFKGSEQPVCSSPDGFLGIGEPGGACQSCPMNQFDPSGGGKPCKNMQRLYILTEGDLLPSLLTLPPSSLKPWFKFMQFLARRGKAFYEVVTAITLESTKNSNGIAYSEARFKKVGDLKSDIVPDIEGVRSTFLPAAKSVDISTTDYLTE